MFQLEIGEYKALRSQFVTLKNLSRGQHRKYMPYVLPNKGLPCSQLY
jgi:hypothetical protein